MLLHLILAVSSVRAFVPYVSTSGGPWVTDVTPGLNWKTASDCGTQFVLNAYYAMAEAHYLGLAAYNSEALFDGPFAQFFGSGWDTSGSATENIWGNINASITYPWKGDRKGRFRPGYQLSVNCKDVVPYTRCSQSGRTVLAYVTAPEGETGPQLSICPVLFNPSLDTSNRRRIPPRRLVDIEKGIPTEELGALFSHGQVMLHGK